MLKSKNMDLSYFVSSRGWFHICVSIVWIAIISVFGLVKLFSFHPAAIVFAFLSIGWLQYVLVQAMHEAVHQFFLRKNGASLAAACLTTYPVGLTRNYLVIHFNHHWNFGDAKADPDSSGYIDPPQTKIEFLARLFSVGLIFPALFQFLRQNTTQRPPNKREDALKYPATTELLNLCAIQFILLAVVSATLGFLYYLLLWILPIITIVKVLSFARIMAEHSTSSGVPVLRSFDTTFVRGVLLGPFGFKHHGAHHRQMVIPFDRLEEFSIWSREQPDDRYKTETFKGCHQSYLWQWFLTLPLFEPRRKK